MSNGIKSPLHFFFKMGEKATGGDPDKQADFIYYMVWILFTAFFWLFIHNAYQLFHGDLNAATWTLVGFAICGIQYFTLKGLYDMRVLRKNKTVAPDDVDVDSVDDMMDMFKEEKEVKNKSKAGKKK